MARTRIFHATYEVISEDNGAAYTLICCADFASVCLQGDDATTFREKFDRCDTAAQKVRLIGEYDHLMGFAED